MSSNWIDLGGVEFCVVSGGRFKLDGGSMFGIIPKPLWEKLEPPDEENRVPLDANCVVVRSGGRVAVIDAGYGNKLSEKDRQIVDLQPGVTIRSAVQQLGIAASEVDFLILSHLHMDHAGGASELGEDGQVRLSFPRARVAVQRGEFEDAVGNRSTMRMSYRSDNLDPLRQAGDQLLLLDGDQELMPGVRAKVTRGHTRAHQTVHLEGRNGRAVYTGDTLATWNHLRPPYNMAFDQEPYLNMLQKLDILEQAARNDWLLVLAHDPRTPMGKVEKVADELFHLKQ